MEILVIIMSSIAFGLFGLAIGFSQMADSDIKKGLKPLTKNKLILLITKPRKEYKGIQILFFIFLTLLWLAILFGLLVVCGILISAYAPKFLAYVYFLIPFFFIGLFIGVKVWKKIPKIET